MAILDGSVKFAHDVLGSSTVAQQNLARLVRGCELLMEGLMNVAIQQIEVTQSLIAGEVADMKLLISATNPAALIEAELEVMRRRSERVLTASRKLTDELSRSWAETFAFLQPSHDPEAGHH